MNLDCVSNFERLCVSASPRETSGPSVCARLSEEFLSAGGKRLRPRLLREVYASLKGGDDHDQRLEKLADAIERLHKATLVHDDIQDGDRARYGRPTVWAQAGVPVAIAVGDLLFAEALRLIATSGFANTAAMLDETSSAVKEVCEGQCDELTHGSDYLSICRRKTGALFGLAASLGALAAGFDPAPYRAWGVLYGTLFQIRDDLADCGESDDLRAIEASFAAKLAEHPLGPFLNIGAEKANERNALA